LLDANTNKEKIEKLSSVPSVEGTWHPHDLIAWCIDYKIPSDVEGTWHPHDNDIMTIFSLDYLCDGIKHFSRDSFLSRSLEQYLEQKDDDMFQAFAGTSPSPFLKLDKVDPTALNKSLDGFVPKNIQVIGNQVHNLLSSSSK
jgi:hypothetical protein